MPPPFAKASERALANWRFVPTLVEGVPVTVATSISVAFRLQGDTREPPPPPACEWRVMVAETGAVSVMTELTSPEACAGWFPLDLSPSVTVAGLSGTCVVQFTEKVEFDDATCVEALRPIAEDLLRHTLFGHASVYKVRIDLPPPS